MKYCVASFLLLAFRFGVARPAHGEGSSPPTESGQDCSRFKKCGACVENLECSWCMGHGTCVSIIDMAANVVECPAPVFSPRVPVRHGDHVLTCEETRSFLPKEYDNKDVSMAIKTPELWSVWPGSVGPSVVINPRAEFFSSQVEWELCYSIWPSTSHAKEDNVDCVNITSGGKIPVHSLPTIGTYVLWAWVLEKGTDKFLCPWHLSVFSRWPSRMLEAMPVFSSSNNNKNVYPHGWFIMPQLRKLNKKVQPIENALPTFLMHPKQIPKIIHQIWTGGYVELKFFQDTFPKSNKKAHFLGWVKTWKQEHPEWTHYLWDLESMWQFISVNYPDFLPIYDMLSTDVKRTDFFRVLILFHLGGVYVDIDFESLEEMDGVLSMGTGDSYDLYMAEHESNYEKFEVPNAWMASVPRHPFWWVFLQEMARRHAKRPHEYITDTTGPHAFSETVEMYRLWFHTSDMMVFKPSVFYPVAPLNKSSMEADFNCIEHNNCTAAYKNSVAVHHYAATWMQFSSGRKGMFHQHFSAACTAHINGAYADMVKSMHSAYDICTTSCLPQRFESIDQATNKTMRCPVTNKTLTCSLTGDLINFTIRADRRYLNQVILPEIARRRPEKVLSVGSAIYSVVQEHEIKRISPSTHFITLDHAKGASIFGSRDVHIVDEAANIGKYLDPGSVDVAILNGVFGWRHDKSEMDETEAVMAAIYRVLKRGGILVLGRNFRHYNGFALASILPLFAPQQLRKDLPVRKTFYEQGSNIDHFYDFLVKQEIAKESQSAPNEKIKTCTSIDGYMRSLESLEEFECNENHLMVVLRGEDAILHGGNSILRGGCWLVVTLSEFDEKKLIALWHSVVVLGASRVFFVPADPLTCRTCAPLFEDGTKRANMLKHIIQDLSWDTIVTYGSDQFTDTRIDPQKKWVYNFVKRHALDKILVFVTNVESRKRLEKYSLGYGTDIGRQHYNMFASWIARTNGYVNPFHHDVGGILLKGCIYSGDCFQLGMPAEVL
jgi:inositol phosphorylceramide mannosyltransferase catalytic subunit